MAMLGRSPIAVPADPEIDGTALDVEDPAAGTLIVTAGPAVSTVQFAVTAVLALPAASYDTTLTVCPPSASPVYVTGLKHAAGVTGAPSSRHPNDTADVSALLNESVAEL